jgi:hypothetical protein
MKQIDFMADAETLPQEGLSILSMRVTELRTAQANVADLERQLSEWCGIVRHLEEVAVPEALGTLGMAEVKLASGEKISVVREYHASIPKATEGAAYDWLRATGNDTLLKRSVTVNFGRGEDSTAAATAAALREQGLPVEEKLSVHPSTLKAFVRERMEEGGALPDAIAVHIINRAKVTIPKAR